MPRRQDLKSILIIGAGPIVIGQACEFDYSGTQACKALREEGYRIILVNSNPATIMTDPETADVTYIEPIQWSVVAQIIEKERPDALLPTMGGQTALNCALALAREGILEKFNVELIGASLAAINKAENRQLFGEAMERIGLQTPRSGLAHSMEEAWAVLEKIGFPAIIRPSFTMGGSGGGIAYNREEFEEICRQGLELSPTRELLIDVSIIGWKEFELEVVRDRKDNCIIVCGIENFDAMGVHTGDSITVAPIQTLTDKEYQKMRNAAIAVLREIGVETGGANVQFAVNPQNGEMRVIEMNPRVSRSSALASKATGFPIAKIAAKLAIGYTLDELKNEITGGRTPASFEPTLDYVVTKIPRFDFKKFPNANTRLTTQMKSVGEVMAIGRTFKESLQKAMRGLEINRYGLDPLFARITEAERSEIRHELRMPGCDRLWYLAEAFRAGISLDEIQQLTHIDPWFLVQIQELLQEESGLLGQALTEVSAASLLRLKQQGFSDRRLAALLQVTETAVREQRHALGVHPVYKRVDTCAAEFSTDTAYLYSTYEEENECLPTTRKKIMVLGGGPNRIGQGIEFDYCCVHAAQAVRELGYESIMVNCNPETVSTDFDLSDRLYFEPLSLEDVLEIVRIEQPLGVIVQYGGQTPLKLASALFALGVPIIGTSPAAIDRAEDREQFRQLVNTLELKQPPNGTVRSIEEGLRLACVFAYPMIVRPSFVLGGRAMRILYNEDEFAQYLRHYTEEISEASPLLLDHFLDNAIEVDVDVVSDGETVMVGGILEHIEQAGVHSGDSSCVLPPHSLSEKMQQQLQDQVIALAKALGVVGLMNAQFAIRDEEIFILEVNPRASRTVPFIAKATGLPLAKIGARCMMGQSLREQNIVFKQHFPYFAIKEAVFPFAKFPGVDPILGPEMRSTGEVMGIAKTFGRAFAKGLWSIGHQLPREGCAFLSVRDRDKKDILRIAKWLLDLKFTLVATTGTAKALQAAGLACRHVHKVTEGRPDVVDLIKNGQIDFIVNTVEGERAIADSYCIRRSAIQYGVCYTTTLAGGEAACFALQEAPFNHDDVISLQQLHEDDRK